MIFWGSIGQEGSHLYIYFAKGSSHLSQSLIFVQVSHLCKSHLCASLTSVQVSHLCKSHIGASLTSVQVSHLCKSHICASFTSEQESHICASLDSCTRLYISGTLLHLRISWAQQDRTRKPVTYFSHSLPGVI